MNNTFTDEQILRLNEYDFNGNQIERLEALDLYLDDIYRDILHIIEAYPPEEPDFDVRISNEMLIHLLEEGYSFEEIESLLEYDFIDEDFEWLLDHPQFIYEDIFHLLGDGWSFNEIKDEIENIPQEDEAELGGKRRRRSVKRSKKQGKTRRRKQGKTRRKKQGKTRKRKQRKH